MIRHFLRQSCRLLAAVTLVLCLTGMAVAQGNPFTGKPAQPAPAAPPQTAAAPGPFTSVAREVLRIQSEMNRELSRHMRAIKEGGSATALLIGMALAFAYGVVHVAGPGHGKLVILSYFLGREARLARGLLLGTQIATTHVIAAIVLVWLADLVLRQSLGGAPGELAAVRVLSYGTITAIGIHMLLQAVRSLRSRGNPAARDIGTHDHDCGLHAGAGRQGDQAQMGLLSFGVGLVPCSGATLIMLYALANGILLSGILMVVAIGVGMAVAMAAIGIAAILMRSAVMARAGEQRRRTWLGPALHLAAGLTITGLGGLLLAATLVT